MHSVWIIGGAFGLFAMWMFDVDPRWIGASAVAWLGFTFNSIVSVKNAAENALSSVTVMLKKRFGGEDLVTGRHGSTDFRFSELRVRCKKRRGKRTEIEIVFHGLFFVADFNKSFRGQTLVLPDKAERALGTVGRAFQSLAGGPAGMKLVELECPEFERAFVVRTTDPVEARYLLSPSLMQRIRAFHENTGAKLRLGFHDGRVSVAVPMPGSNLFALDANQSLDLGRVRTWVGELLLATGIVDELDLNTRIWSKAPAA